MQATPAGTRHLIGTLPVLRGQGLAEAALDGLSALADIWAFRSA
ncbi:hypothetical protein OHR68_17490 [Spirillospora sp. NBC_00431]